MDEKKVQIGDDVILDLGINSEWCITSISYYNISDTKTISIDLERKDDRIRRFLGFVR